MRRRSATVSHCRPGPCCARGSMRATATCSSGCTTISTTPTRSARRSPSHRRRHRSPGGSPRWPSPTTRLRLSSTCPIRRDCSRAMRARAWKPSRCSAARSRTPASHRSGRPRRIPASRRCAPWSPRSAGRRTTSCSARSPITTRRAKPRRAPRDGAGTAHGQLRHQALWAAERHPR